LLNRSKDTGEHGMGLGAACGSIAAADLARDDSRPQGVLGAPVGGGNRVGFEEKGKHRREFDGEVRGEAAGDLCGAGLIDQNVELILKMAAGDGDPVRGDASSLVPVADVQGPLQDALDPRGEAALLMIANQDPAAA
jgi:hypothetical protein